MSNEFQLLVIVLIVSWVAGLAIIAMMASLLRRAYLRLVELSGILVPRRGGMPSPFFSPGDKPTGRYGDPTSIEEQLLKMQGEDARKRQKREKEEVAKGPSEDVVHGLGMRGFGGAGDAKV